MNIRFIMEFSFGALLNAAVVVHPSNFTSATKQLSEMKSPLSGQLLRTADSSTDS